MKENVRGSVYIIIGKSEDQKGLLLEKRATNLTFEEWGKGQTFSHWLVEHDETPKDYYEIESDIIQEGSMTAPTIFGIFIPRGKDLKTVADKLRDKWGPGSKLLY